MRLWIVTYLICYWLYFLSNHHAYSRVLAKQVTTQIVFVCNKIFMKTKLDNEQNRSNVCKAHIVKTMVFPVMSECENWTINKVECWRVDAFKLWWLEKTLESPLYCKEINPVDPKGNQPWMLTGRTDVEAPILWSPDAKSRLTGKDPGAGKDWGREEKGVTEDEMVGWHLRFSEHEFKQILGDSKGQESLACHSPGGRRESNMTERLNWTELNWKCWIKHLFILILHIFL